MRSAGILGLSGAVLGRLPGRYMASAAQAATYDPRKYAGAKISLLMVGGEGDDKAIATSYLNSKPRPEFGWRSRRRNWAR